MALFSIVLFVVSLAILVKGADWFLESSEKIGLKMGLSRFIVGALIVGLGTSLPELASSIAAIGEGETTIVAANAVGSNIANILLIVGVASIVAGRLTMNKDLIELDLPMLVGATAIFAAVAWDGIISIPEAWFLVIAYVVYFGYTIFHTEKLEDKDIPDGSYRRAMIDKARAMTGGLFRKKASSVSKEEVSKDAISTMDFVKLVVGVAGLVIGAKYLIVAVLDISEAFGILPGLISLSAVAFGTSLPELFVSIKAALRGNSDIAIGNIFGSNIFNLLLVVGIPGLMTSLVVDSQTIFSLVVMSVVTFLFVVSGLSQKIYLWEGSLFLLMYGFFTAKIFGLL
jgi:cation:H+ antiporter